MKVKYDHLQPGDVFAFHVGNGKFAFARLLFSIDRTADICEIFDYQSDNLEFKKEIVRSQRLMPLQDLNIWEALKPSMWKWTVVSRDEKFLASRNELVDLEFSLGRGQSMRFNIDWQPGSDAMRIVTRRAESKELAALETSDMFLNMHWLYVRIRRLWNLHPNEWDSPLSMWQWLYENKVFFKRRY